MSHYARDEDYADEATCYFKLMLAGGLDINDNRDKLPPVNDGYVVRLVVGADDGAARTFEVEIDWDGDGKQKPDELLKAALAHHQVRRV